MTGQREFILDWDRTARTGTGEAVFCAGKTAAQIEAILEEAQSRKASLLLTRLDEAKQALLPDTLPLDFDPLSRTAFYGALPPATPSGIGVVCAGTGDLPFAREALRTLRFHGAEATLVADVGVAGLWRLLDRLEQLREFRVIIACAGMEGALFSVLAGLVRAPVIAVPTSVGYGVATDGAAALSSALASCAPGVLTVNIDNGFGAAIAALKIRGFAMDGGEVAAESSGPASD